MVDSKWKHIFFHLKNNLKTMKNLSVLTSHPYIGLSTVSSCYSNSSEIVKSMKKETWKWLIQVPKLAKLELLKKPLKVCTYLTSLTSRELFHAITVELHVLYS